MEKIWFLPGTERPLEEEGPRFVQGRGVRALQNSQVVSSSAVSARAAAGQALEELPHAGPRARGRQHLGTDASGSQLTDRAG